MAKTNFCPKCSDEVPVDGALCRRCRSDPYPEDTHIRVHGGLTISDRPTRGPAIWSDGKKRYSQQEAVALADRFYEACRD